MADIDLSAVSTADLFRVLSERLVGTELKEVDHHDRWKAPEPIDVVHAVLKLIAQPRLTGGGDWPKLPRERFHEIADVFDRIRDATLEPDSDGDHVLRLHYEVRSTGYLAAEPMTVPYDILTPDDLRTAQQAIRMLGLSIDRISTSVALSVGHFVKDIELTPHGQQMLTERNAKAKA